MTTLTEREQKSQGELRRKLEEKKYVPPEKAKVVINRTGRGQKPSTSTASTAPVEYSTDPYWVND